MKFCSLVLELHLPQNVCLTHTDTQTDRHFPKDISNLCSGHPKTCKSIKNRKSKICTKPILSSTYIEESKNKCFTIFAILHTSVLKYLYITLYGKHLKKEHNLKEFFVVEHFDLISNIFIKMPLTSQH